MKLILFSLLAVLCFGTSNAKATESIYTFNRAILIYNYDLSHEVLLTSDLYTAHIRCGIVEAMSEFVLYSGNKIGVDGKHVLTASAKTKSDFDVFCKHPYHKQLVLSDSQPMNITIESINSKSIVTSIL